MPTLLVANIHFSPFSFGGATVIAENLSAILSDAHGWKVVVITAHQNNEAHPYSCIRYTTGGIDVFSIVIPYDRFLSYEERYDNQKYRQAFSCILKRLDVDAAHVHSIQNVGIGVMDELARAGIPTVVTMHDCWWICERMFMINSKGKYCHQRKIDMNVCRYCVADIGDTRIRDTKLRDALSKVDLMLFPSEFHRGLYVDNGFPAKKCLVNKNGVRRPHVPPKPRKRKEYFTFGFVGGPGEIKGGTLIRKAFEELTASNYKLIVVDAARNRGLSWKSGFQWDIPGELEIVPPYNQDTMDDFFGRLDVLLFPTQWKESFGLTVREAIARGVWVIATDAGGVSEDCIEGINANLIPLNGSHKELAQAISNILEQGMPVLPSHENITYVEDQAEELHRILSRLVN